MVMPVVNSPVGIFSPERVRAGSAFTQLISHIQSIDPSSQTQDFGFMLPTIDQCRIKYECDVVGYLQSISVLGDLDDLLPSESERFLQPEFIQHIYYQLLCDIAMPREEQVQLLTRLELIINHEEEIDGSSYSFVDLPVNVQGVLTNLQRALLMQLASTPEEIQHAQIEFRLDVFIEMLKMELDRFSSQYFAGELLDARRREFESLLAFLKQKKTAIKEYRESFDQRVREELVGGNNLDIVSGVESFAKMKHELRDKESIPKDIGADEVYRAVNSRVSQVLVSRCLDNRLSQLLNRLLQFLKEAFSRNTSKMRSSVANRRRGHSKAYKRFLAAKTGVGKARICAPGTPAIFRLLRTPGQSPDVSFTPKTHVTTPRDMSNPTDALGDRVARRLF